jgi:hypothetical protein
VFVGLPYHASQQTPAISYRKIFLLHTRWQFHSTTFPVLEFTDGFSDSEGVPDLDLPASRVRVEVLESGGLGRIRFTSVYESEEAVTTVLKMGLQEGITLAMQQIEGTV